MARQREEVTSGGERRGWQKAHEHWRFCVLRAATQPTGWSGISRSSLTSAGCIIRLGLQEQGFGIGDQGSGNVGRLRWIQGGLVWSGEWNFRIAPAIVVFRDQRLWLAV